jgi:hypothetical protein
MPFSIRPAISDIGKIRGKCGPLAVDTMAGFTAKLGD